MNIHLHFSNTQSEFLPVLAAMAALLVGTLIGYVFGLVQDAAARRNQRRHDMGQLSSGWAVMPGSMRRVGYLLIALAGVQLICPLLFNGGCQWLVSGGVVAGYGWALWRRLRKTLASARGH